MTHNNQLSCTRNLHFYGDTIRHLSKQICLNKLCLHLLSSGLLCNDSWIREAKIEVTSCCKAINFTAECAHVWDCLVQSLAGWQGASWQKLIPHRLFPYVIFYSHTTPFKWMTWGHKESSEDACGHTEQLSSFCGMAYCKLAGVWFWLVPFLHVGKTSLCYRYTVAKKVFMKQNIDTFHFFYQPCLLLIFTIQVCHADHNQLVQVEVESWLIKLKLVCHFVVLYPSPTAQLAFLLSVANDYEPLTWHLQRIQCVCTMRALKSGCGWP